MMNNLSQLVQWAKNIAKEYPIHRDEIWNLISLCQDEIEEGGSEPHEVELCYTEICQLTGIDE
jgi:hypothetical protein